MNKKNLIFKYFTNTRSLIAFLSIFALTISLAILLRFELLNKKTISDHFLGSVIFKDIAKKTSFELKQDQTSSNDEYYVKFAF